MTQMNCREIAAVTAGGQAPASAAANFQSVSKKLASLAWPSRLFSARCEQASVGYPRLSRLTWPRRTWAAEWPWVRASAGREYGALPVVVVVSV